MPIKGWVWTGLFVIGLGGVTLATLWWGRSAALQRAERQLPLLPVEARIAGFRAFLDYGALPALDATGAEVTLTPQAARGIEAPDCARTVDLVNTAGRGRTYPDWQAEVTLTCPYRIDTDAGPLRVILHSEDRTGPNGAVSILPLRPLRGERLQRAAAELMP